MVKILLFLIPVLIVHGHPDIATDLGLNLTRPYVVRVYKFLCVETPYKNTELHICNMKLRRDKPASLNLHFTFTKPTNVMHLAFTMFYKYTTFQPFLMQFDIDLCKYFNEERGKNINKIVDFVIDFAASQVSWIDRCPYYGRYNITNFQVTPEIMPKFLPAGDYRLDARHYDENNNTWMYFQIFCSVRAKGLIDLSMG